MPESKRSNAVQVASHILIKAFSMAALVIGICAPLSSQQSEQPRKVVGQSNERTDTDKTKKATPEQQFSQAETIREMRTQIGQLQQQRAQEIKDSEAQQKKDAQVNGKIETYTFWLVVVGAFQALILAGTVWVIYVQSQLAWWNQRAQLAVEAHGIPINELISDHPRVQLELTNRGTTPAYNCVYESWIELLPRDCEDFTALVEHFKAPYSFVLFQAQGPMVINIPFQNGLTITQKQDVGRALKTAFVRIRVEYRDRRKSRRYIDFGYRVDLEGLATLAKYSDAN
jgi:hypothetical protein